MPASLGTVLTIGHSTHPIEIFLGLLERHRVTAVADVRAAPYSRFNPQYNREALAASLAAYGMAYVYLGTELGGRSDDPACYEDGRISYERLAGTRAFREGIERVVQGTARHRIALMCAEKEPLECHRCLLVAPVLEARGVSAAHIRPGGEQEVKKETHPDAMGGRLAETGNGARIPASREEAHADAMCRLLAEHGLQDALEEQLLPPFRRSRAERITEAVALQARLFAHRKKPATLPGDSLRSGGRGGVTQA